MSDLAADEARRAAEWLESIGWPESARELRKYADPPETVESLRAERDEARAELIEARDDAHEQRAYLAHYRRKGVADDAELARLRATHMEDEATVAWARGLKLSWSHSGPATEVLAPESPQHRVARHPSHWPGPEHWLGGDHSNQAPWEQGGKTPGQTLYELTHSTGLAWDQAGQSWRDMSERNANAVLAAHGTPTLTPVGEHPKQGTRGLLPVVVNASDEWVSKLEPFHCVLEAESEIVGVILADPRPDGAL